MNPRELDKISIKYNRYAFGMPEKFWDWYEKDFDIIRPVNYKRHALERHTTKFRNPYRNLVTDTMTYLNIGQGEAFECWYLPDGTLRKFCLSLPCYCEKTNSWAWHDDYDYVASICFEDGVYHISTVFPRKVGNIKIYDKNQYSKP